MSENCKMQHNRDQWNLIQKSKANGAKGGCPIR